MKIKNNASKKIWITVCITICCNIYPLTSDAPSKSLSLLLSPSSLFIKCACKICDMLYGGIYKEITKEIVGNIAGSKVVGDFYVVTITQQDIAELSIEAGWTFYDKGFMAIPSALLKKIISDSAFYLIKQGAICCNMENYRLGSSLMRHTLLLCIARIALREMIGRFIDNGLTQEVIERNRFSPLFHQLIK